MPFHKAVLRHALVALILSAGLEAPAFGAVTYTWAGTEGSPAARGGYIAYSTRSVAAKNGDVNGPPELWGGVPANPQRIITAQAPAPSFDSLTITGIGSLVVDDDGAVTFTATLSDGSEVLYSGTAGTLKVLAGRGPAVENMTGLLTTKLTQVYSVDVNALGVSANDGSLWVHAAGKTTALGTIAGFGLGEPPPWADGHAVVARLSQATIDGAFALQVQDAEETGREYGIAIGSTASDITLPIPFSAPAALTQLAPFSPARDAAGDVVFALAAWNSGPITALELVTGGTQSELARVGQAAPGIAGNVTDILRPASISASGRIVFFVRSDQIRCAAEDSCGTVYTGSPGHVYPAAASGYELPGTGATITHLKLVSGINEKGQFVVKGSIPVPHAILLDVAFYLYDPSVGFTRILDEATAQAEVEPGSINSFLDAIPAGDDQFFLKTLYHTPSVHSTWALATVSGLTPVGTDIAVDPSTFASAGTGSGGTSGTGGSRPSAGGATARGGAGSTVNGSGGAAAVPANAGAGTTAVREPQGKSGGCGLAGASRQNPFAALGILASATLLAIRRRRAARR